MVSVAGLAMRHCGLTQVCRKDGCMTADGDEGLAMPAVVVSVRLWLTAAAVHTALPLYASSTPTDVG